MNIHTCLKCLLAGEVRLIPDDVLALVQANRAPTGDYLAKEASTLGGRK